jgi:hypothetical protein
MLYTTTDDHARALCYPRLEHFVMNGFDVPVTAATTNSTLYDDMCVLDVPLHAASMWE